MKGFRLIALALAIGIALLANSVVVDAQAATGTIKGKIVNKTPGGEAVGGQSLDLLSFAADGQRDKRTVTVGADGSFVFENLPTKDQMYILAANFLGVTYHSEEVDLSKGEAVREVEMPVYSTTKDASAVGISRGHLVVDYDTDKKSLVILEMFVFTNKGDRTYVGGEKKTAEGKPETLRIRLPEGATQVRFTEGLNELQSAVVDGVVVDTAAVPPTGRQVVMSYLVPYKDASATLARQFDYPVERLILLAREVGAQVTAEGLPAKDTRDMGGTRYLQLSGDNIAVGKQVSIGITGIPATVASPANEGRPTAAAANGQQQLAYGAVALAGLGVVLGVGYPLLRRRRTQPSQRLKGESQASNTQWDELVEAIAALDDAYDAGDIPDAEYRRKRAKMKAELQQMGRRLRGA